MFFTPLVYASGYLVLVFLAICMVRRCPCDLSRHSRAACGPSVAAAPRGVSMQLQGSLRTRRRFPSMRASGTPCMTLCDCTCPRCVTQAFRLRRHGAVFVVGNAPFH